MTARLAGVLQDLASAGDVLAESLDLSLRTPLDALRSDVSRIDDKKRACDRADDQASSTEAELLRGDWRRVERDVLRGEKLRSRGEESDLPRRSRPWSINARGTAPSLVDWRSCDGLNSRDSRHRYDDGRGSCWRKPP